MNVKGSWGSKRENCCCDCCMSHNVALSVFKPDVVLWLFGDAHFCWDSCKYSKCCFILTELCQVWQMQRSEGSDKGSESVSLQAAFTHSMQCVLTRGRNVSAQIFDNMTYKSVPTWQLCHHTQVLGWLVGWKKSKMIDIEEKQKHIRVLWQPEMGTE